MMKTSSKGSGDLRNEKENKKKSNKILFKKNDPNELFSIKFTERIELAIRQNVYD